MRITLIAAVIVFSTAPATWPEDRLPLDQQLVYACYKLNQFRVVQSLRNGADVNARFGESQIPLSPRSEWTPILALAQSIRASSTEGLGNTRVANKKLESQKRLAILRILLSHDCKLNAKDSNGATALYIAILRKDSDFTKLLLTFKPDVNAMVSDGPIRDSPLRAAQRWSPEISDLLMERGAELGPESITIDQPDL